MKAINMKQSRKNHPTLLFIVNDTEFFASHRLPIGQAAIKEGYEVHLSALRNRRVAEIIDAGIQIHDLPIDRAGLNPVSDLKLLYAIHHVLRDVRPDIVHNVTHKPVLYGGLAARVCSVPAVVHALSGLGYVYEEEVKITRKLLRYIVHTSFRMSLAHPNSRVIFQNEESRDQFIQDGLVGSWQAVLIRGSGVDTCLFVPTPEPEGEPVVLLPARLLWSKGVGEFVEAARVIRTGRIPARFALAGEIPEHHPNAVPREVIAGWVQEGIIEWWGHCNDMPARFAASHIVCLPSYYREGLPKALAEAAAAGRPIVTTRTPGCHDVVVDGVNGLLVPPRDARALVQALNSLLADATARRRMGSAGRERAVAEFSIGGIVEKTLAIYNSLISSNHPVERQSS